MLKDFVAENKRAKKDAIEKFLHANRNWDKQLENVAVDIEYDPDGDYLWVQIGEQGETIAAFTVDEGFVLLVDSNSYELRAVECPSFLEKAKKGWVKEGLWSTLAEHIREGHHHIYILPERERREVQQSLGALVPA